MRRRQWWSQMIAGETVKRRHWRATYRCKSWPRKRHGTEVMIETHLLITELGSLRKGGVALAVIEVQTSQMMTAENATAMTTKTQITAKCAKDWREITSIPYIGAQYFLLRKWAPSYRRHRELLSNIIPTLPVCWSSARQRDWFSRFPQ